MDFVSGEVMPIPARKLTAETVQRYGYKIGKYKGKTCQIAEYRDANGKLLAQKLRFKDKSFLSVGSMKDAPLFGRHLCRDGGRMLVVTEGEIDAMSVSQAFGNKWPAVSIPNGAQSAEKAFRRNIEWLCKFDRVVIMFDEDEPGRRAAEAAAAVLPPGKAYIASLSEKDANDMLKAGKVEELVNACWGAQPWRPDGIISGQDITIEELRQVTSPGYELPYPLLQDSLQGLRKRELTLLTAGSGIGKSTLAREIAYHLRKAHSLVIGNVYLEESYDKTAKGYIAIDNDVPLGALRMNPDLLTQEQWQRSLDQIVKPMYFYDHFGSLESEHLLAKLEYLATGVECDFIVLDHISMVVSGQEGSGEGERKDIDRLMTHLRSMIERTGVGVIGIVHLRRPGGNRTSYNEGGRVTLQDLRGAGSLEQLSDNVLALERDQQDAERSNYCRLRVLKNREFGDLGEKDLLFYNNQTGRLLPTDEPEFEPEGPSDSNDNPNF